MIYLDWNATSPLRPEAYRAMEPYWQKFFGNPSSIHAAGRDARVALDEARESVAALIGCEPREIVFTSGATEANNLMIQGAALRWPGKRFISSAVEHPSVLEPLAALQQRGAIRWEKFAMDQEGAIPQEILASTLDGKSGEAPAFATVMLANNETGRIFPLAEVAAEARKAGVHVHSDLTQAAGRIPIHVKTMGLDSAVLSAHKLGGPKGIGALYVKRGITIEKTVFGGKQERSRRPGTENVPAIVAFGVAAAAARAELETVPARWTQLRERLWKGLQELPVKPVLNTPFDASVANTLNISLPGYDGNFLLQRLDIAGLCISSGAACSSGTPEPSPVLRAIGYDVGRIQSALRFSLGYATTEADIDGAIKILFSVVKPT